MSEKLSDLLFDLDNIEDNVEVEDTKKTTAAAAASDAAPFKSKKEIATEEFIKLENEFNALYSQIQGERSRLHEIKVKKCQKLYNQLLDYRSEHATITAEIESYNGFKGTIHPFKKKAAETKLSDLQNKYSGVCKLNEKDLLKVIESPMKESINTSLARAAYQAAVTNCKNGAISAQVRNNKIRAAIEKLKSSLDDN